MDLKQLLSDDRGVSPVIGVILMVAITVILAAVIGTFVLGLGSNVGNNAPSATFNYDYQNFSNDSATNTITIADQGGDAIDSSTITVNVGSESLNASEGTSASSGDYSVTSTDWDTGQIQAGDSITVSGTNTTPSGGTDVQVVWQSSGGSSSIISSSTTPQ